MLRRQLLTAAKVTMALVVCLGVIYPLVVWGVAQIAFPRQANGSLIKSHGNVIGSSLIGQSFSDKDGNPLPKYFQPRPSLAGSGYDASSSSASNLGPSSPQLLATCLLQKAAGGTPECDPNTVPQRVLAYQQFNHLAPGTPVPVDAVTASGSGLDPDISEANALDQAPRVAAARHLSVDQVLAVVHSHVRNRPWGFLGENTVNVLDLNLALDHR
jgi:K+-transporting ATPase ATPase C chain